MSIWEFTWASPPPYSHLANQHEQLSVLNLHWICVLWIWEIIEIQLDKWSTAAAAGVIVKIPFLPTNAPLIKHIKC